jgi:hypothetical protein
VLTLVTFLPLYLKSFFGIFSNDMSCRREKRQKKKIQRFHNNNVENGKYEFGRQQPAENYNNIPSVCEVVFARNE